MQQNKSKFKIFLDSLEKRGFFRGIKNSPELVSLWFVIFMLVGGLEIFLGSIANKIFNLEIMVGSPQLDMVFFVLLLGVPAVSGFLICRWVWQKGTYEYYEVLEKSVVMKDFFIFIVAGTTLGLGIAALSLRERIWGIISLVFTSGVLIFNFKNVSLTDILQRVARVLTIAVLIIASVAVISFVVITITNFLA